jgi:hypothetical protein
MVCNYYWTPSCIRKSRVEICENCVDFVDSDAKAFFEESSEITSSEGDKIRVLHEILFDVHKERISHEVVGAIKNFTEWATNIISSRELLISYVRIEVVKLFVSLDIDTVVSLVGEDEGNWLNAIIDEHESKRCFSNFINRFGKAFFSSWKLERRFLEKNFQILPFQSIKSAFILKRFRFVRYFHDKYKIKTKGIEKYNFHEKQRIFTLLPYMGRKTRCHTEVFGLILYDFLRL